MTLRIPEIDLEYYWLKFEDPEKKRKQYENMSKFDKNVSGIHNLENVAAVWWVGNRILRKFRELLKNIDSVLYYYIKSDATYGQNQIFKGRRPHSKTAVFPLKGISSICQSVLYTCLFRHLRWSKHFLVTF